MTFLPMIAACKPVGKHFLKIVAQAFKNVRLCQVIFQIKPTRFIFNLKFVVFVLFGSFLGMQRYLAVGPHSKICTRRAEIDGTAKTSSSERPEAGHSEKMIGVDACWSKVSPYGLSFLLILMFAKDVPEHVWETDKQSDQDQKRSEAARYHYYVLQNNACCKDYLPKLELQYDSRSVTVVSSIKKIFTS